MTRHTFKHSSIPPFSPSFITIYNHILGLQRLFGLCASPNDSMSRQSKQKHCYCSCTRWKAGAESKTRGQMAPPATGDWRCSILASLHCSRVLPCNREIFACNNMTLREVRTQAISTVLESENIT